MSALAHALGLQPGPRTDTELVSACLSGDEQAWNELIDRYKLFIGIQNNKLSKMFERRVFQGMMDSLYLNVDPEIKAMMRMYEFFEIDGLSLLEMFDKKGSPIDGRTAELIAPGQHRTA